MVDTYLSDLDEQEVAKRNAVNGLDSEFQWINICALLLYGILNCSSTDAQNAQVFFRIIEPSLPNEISCTDKDIRMSLFFMTNLATILFAMQKDLVANAFKRRGTENKPKKFNF